MMFQVLVIECGGKKLQTRKSVPIWSLYTGPLWSTYRSTRARREGASVRGSHPSLNVFVLSAEHGLLPETDRCSPYDRVLVADSFRGTHKKGTPVRRVSQMVPLVRVQALRHGLTEVWFSGSAVYRGLLEQAGLKVHDLDSRGIGFKRSALGVFLSNAPDLDLDKLLKQVER